MKIIVYNPLRVKEKLKKIFKELYEKHNFASTYKEYYALIDASHLLFSHQDFNYKVEYDYSDSTTQKLVANHVFKKLRFVHFIKSNYDRYEERMIPIKPSLKVDEIEAALTRLQDPAEIITYAEDISFGIDGGHFKKCLYTYVYINTATIPILLVKDLEKGNLNFSEKTFVKAYASKAFEFFSELFKTVKVETVEF